MVFMRKMGLQDYGTGPRDAFFPFVELLLNYLLNSLPL